MRVISLVGVVLLLAGCGKEATTDQATLTEGRTYTQWLFAHDFDKLWARFSPEMQRTFPTVSDLSVFAGRTAQELGGESGQPAERTNTVGATRIYTRTSTFDRARARVELQWTMGTDGRVTGLLVHPVTDSAGR